MRRIATLPRLLFQLAAICVLAAPPSAVFAHSPEDSYSARVDLRIDEQRGLRVRTWFEVPEASKVAQGNAAAGVLELASCLELTLGGELLTGHWVAGGDPKHGLSNGSHRLFALEFEPDALPGGSSLDVALVVDCFPAKDLSLSATSRAKPPWRVAEEALPERTPEAQPHHHGESLGDEAKPTRRARVRFSRDQ